MRCASLWLSFLAVCTIVSAQSPVVLRSPDGRLQIQFETATNNRPAESGQLVYSITAGGKPLLDRSGLRLDLQGYRPLGTEGVRIVKTTPGTVDETYKLIAGKRNMVRNHYNFLLVDTQDNEGRQLTIEARAYDDAVAFRYVIPDQAGLHEFRLTKEATEFHLSKDATTYALVLPNFRTSYESEYIKLNASAFAGKAGLSGADLIGLPLLMEVPGVAWMAITEADLRGNSAMYLKNPSTEWGGHRFESVIAPGDDPEVLVSSTLPHNTAWRVLLIGDEPGRLIESSVITSLNPPSAIADTSWIHPGLTAWDWWSGSIGPDGQSAFTTATMKYYVDFAADSGFPYMLVDAGWSVRNDITKMNGKVDIPALVQYASAKNVKIWIWMHHDAVDEQMNDAFPLYEKWGVAGIKVDFIERDDQRGINFYYRVAEAAAQHHLMVDFHGATKPWGIERTYPNVLGYEAVLGMEQSRAGMRDNPDHRATLPFTRMLAGPMDYTPGGFDNVTKTDFVARNNHVMVMGTRAQQLAMYAIYDAPFQMVSDTPSAYKDQPAFEFIRHASATWDDTKVLGGRPGEYILMARRRGDEWFVGSLTNWSSRDLDIPLAFLGDGKYRAEIYADAPDADRYPKSVSVRKQTVDRNMHLKAQLASGGGYAVRFVPLH
jgi:alpha-glucosidase